MQNLRNYMALFVLILMSQSATTVTTSNTVINNVVTAPEEKDRGFRFATKSEKQLAEARAAKKLQDMDKSWMRRWVEDISFGLKDGAKLVKEYTWDMPHSGKALIAIVVVYGLCKYYVERKHFEIMAIYNRDIV